MFMCHFTFTCMTVMYKTIYCNLSFLSSSKFFLLLCQFHIWNSLFPKIRCSKPMFITPAFGSCDQDYKHDVLFIIKKNEILGLFYFVCSDCLAQAISILLFCLHNLFSRFKKVLQLIQPLKSCIFGNEIKLYWS